MSLDDSSYGSEPDSVSWKLRRGVQPLKRLEKPVCEPRFETAAIVFHEIHILSVFLDLAQFNPRVIVLRRIFPGVAEQIFQHDSQEVRVAVNFQFGRSDE